MKKTLALVLAAVMLLSLLSACKSSADETPTVDPAETEQTTTPEETTPAEEQTPEEKVEALNLLLLTHIYYQLVAISN